MVHNTIHKIISDTTDTVLVDSHTLRHARMQKIHSITITNAHDTSSSLMDIYKYRPDVNSINRRGNTEFNTSGHTRVPETIYITRVTVPPLATFKLEAGELAVDFNTYDLRFKSHTSVDAHLIIKLK